MVTSSSLFTNEWWPIWVPCLSLLLKTIVMAIKWDNYMFCDHQLYLFHDCINHTSNSHSSTGDIKWEEHELPCLLPSWRQSSVLLQNPQRNPGCCATLVYSLLLCPLNFQWIFHSSWLERRSAIHNLIVYHLPTSTEVVKSRSPCTLLQNKNPQTTLCKKLERAFYWNTITN